MHEKNLFDSSFEYIFCGDHFLTEGCYKDVNSESPGVESPFVVKREDIFQSKTPYSWKEYDLVKRIDPWHAAEVVCDLDGRWYITLSTGLEEHDLKMAPFYWK